MKMKKRYIMKRYGLAAVILLFLLIWLGQQNAVDNSIRNTIPIEQRPALYDPHKGLDIDIEKEQNTGRVHEAKQHPGHKLDYQLSSRNTTRSNTSADWQILLNVNEKDRSKSQNLFDKNYNEASYGHGERSDRNSTRVFNGAQRLSNTDEIELDSQRRTNEQPGVINSKIRQRFRSSTAVNTVALFPVNTTTEYLQRRPVFNESAVASEAEPRTVPRNNSSDQSLNLERTIIRPLTVRQQVLSGNDEEKDDSLILARQLALKNFVKTDEKHSYVDQSAHINASSKTSDMLPIQSNQQDQYKRLFENVVPNSSAGRVRKQEIDELRKFAEVPTLPDYDLPMLKAKSSDARVTISPVVSQLVSGRVSTVSYLVSNKTVDKDSPSKLDDDEVLADTDDVMSSAVVLGEVNPNKTYAVFSTTTENRDALNFVFLLPLTALAWKRIGFDSIVIIVGPVDIWNSDELFHFVLSVVRQLDAVVVFLEPRTEKSVMISQVSRIFIANVLRARAAVTNRQRPDLIDNTYLLTSDTDIWPIYGDMYRLPPGRDILSLNSECCGAFSHRNVAYRMLPMANVGMRIGTWRRLTRRFGESPRSVDDILTAVVREFGPVALRPVHKGANIGWFLDQMMVSLLVAEWTKRHGTDRVKLIPRDVGVDRLDRNAWGPGDSGGIADKIDAHLLGSAYLPGVWAQIMPLVRHLYGFETDRYNWCVEYYDSFQKLFVAKYRSQGGVGDNR